MNKQQMLKGIQDQEERLFFAKVLDQAAFALKRYEVQFSDFMDAARCGRCMERLKNNADLEVLAFGGVENAERLMLGLAPKQEMISNEHFPISALQIAPKNRKFAQTDLSHRDYLGSILGLGIERGKLGDILVSEDGAVCFVNEEMADYIQTNLEKVSKTAVSVTKPDQAEILAPKRTEIRRQTVASLRLDAVLGEALHLSRGKAQTLISSEKVNVNWSVVTSTSYILKTGDMVSARGFGRFLVGEVSGRTKKDRIALEVEMYI
ncbi:MAG: YlmH/Sll1252 family protein [Anaerotignum sp.]|nr:YlmH/Sll1252 family protein [Anaerotignum sp.]